MGQAQQKELEALPVESMALWQPCRSVDDPADRIGIRSFIRNEEAKMQVSEQRIVELPHVDHFADGLYARELFMPAGIVVTSKIHKTNHFCFVLRGAAEVIDENSGYEVIEAPCMIRTKAGTKRILRILEDSLWITVHATMETDVDEIEKQIIATDYLDLVEGQK